MKSSQNKNKILKALVLILELLAFALLLYLVFLPIIPAAEYDIANYRKTLPESKNIEVVKKDTVKIVNQLPKNKDDISANRFIITKIGVNAPIVESKNSEYGLSLGAWHVPGSANPEKTGNIVLTGHRFKYLPPSNLTFYLFDKLEAGDIVSIIWNQKTYYYKIRETKVVDKTDLSVEAPSDKPIITMYTCTPIYSTAKRLVVIGDLVK